jgi:8-oxo-dGTP pyrophosphatase MutT (NUDIX family)
MARKTGRGRSKDDAPSVQVGALPVRRAPDGTLQVLLVTSRETRRWVIPKGWPMKGFTKARAAEREAREEAGVCGRIDRHALGTYLYWKRQPTRIILCEVHVFVLDTERTLENWREKGERDIAWFSLAEAAQRVDEPGLSTLILSLEQAARRDRKNVA